MEYYILALKALYLLLKRTGVNYWADWIEFDIKQAEFNSVDHHLKAYGGMGTLNDVIICCENHHNISKEQEPWIHVLFDDLKGLCITTARIVDITPLEILNRSLRKNPKEIQGWRCLKCGFGKLSNNNIVSYIAPEILRGMLLSAIESKNLEECVGRVLNLDIPEKDQRINNIKYIAEKSGIHVDNDNSWLRPCPACGSNDTAVYRWIERKRIFSGIKFVPSSDNLNMKN